MSADNRAAIEALVRRYRELGAAMAELAGEREEIKNRVDSLVEVGWKEHIDGVGVYKRPANRVFDPIVAASLLDEHARALCVVTRFDDKRLREEVEKAGSLELCMITPTNAAPVVKL